MMIQAVYYCNALNIMSMV